MANQLTYVSGRPKMFTYTPASAKLAGDVVVIGGFPVVLHAPNPQYGTTTAQDAASSGGGIYKGIADGALAVGARVFWDDTNDKFSATSVGNTDFGILLAGPTGDLVGAGPASDGDAAYVLHDPRSSTPGLSATGKKAENTQSTTATLSIAQTLGGFINSAPGAGITLTLPTAANLVAGMIGCKVGDEITLSIENTAGGANSITLAAGSGGTLRGGTTVAQNKSALIRIVLTNVTASSEAYTAHSIIGA